MQTNKQLKELVKTWGPPVGWALATVSSAGMALLVMTEMSWKLDTLPTLFTVQGALAYIGLAFLARACGSNINLPTPRYIIYTHDKSYRYWRKRYPPRFATHMMLLDAARDPKDGFSHVEGIGSSASCEGIERWYHLYDDSRDAEHEQEFRQWYLKWKFDIRVARK